MSNLTAVAYYAGIPPNNRNPEKPQILDNFCQGVRASGDTAIQHQGMHAISCDVALIQGFVHEHGKSAPHLQLRQDAVNLQKNTNRRSLIVDSNLFLYADPNNTKTYLRYSFDGVFPTTGFYFDRDIDPARWVKISRDLNISLKPWRTQGNHILICLQRHGGWSMGGVGVQTWLDQTIAQIRQVSAGSSVGYDRAAMMEKDTRIATVRIGYADGYDRRFSRGAGKMYINGVLCPVVGLVCMDMTMIDVSAVKDISINDEVEIFGEHIAIETLAAWSGINMYEMMSGINARVKRIYIEE